MLRQKVLSTGMAPGHGSAITSTSSTDAGLFYDSFKLGDSSAGNTGWHGTGKKRRLKVSLDI